MQYRAFIAAIIAASVAVTGFAAQPARADSDDIAKIIVGAAALAVIGTAIADHKKDKRRERAARHQTYYDPPYGHAYGYRNNHGHLSKRHKHKYKHHHGHRTHSHKYSRNHHHSNDRHHYSGLKKRHHNSVLKGSRAHLPGRCKTSGHNSHGYVRGYDRRCLFNNYSHYNALPHHCAVRVYGSKAPIYTRDCLRRQGYRVSDRK